MSVRVVKDTRGAGLAAMKRRLRQGQGRVLVGVPAGKLEADGTPIALVAAVNEFGSEDGRVPERSHLRAGLREGRQEFRRLNMRTLGAVARGTMSENQALGLLGQAGVRAVKLRMQRGPFVPNAPATIKAKTVNGKVGDRPLFDTSQLFQTYTYVVEGA